MKRISLHLFVACTVLAAAACQGGGSEVSVHDSIVEDDEYLEAYESATREAEIYKDFEHRYKVTATYLSPRFRTAFARRLKDLLIRDHPSFEEAGGKSGFFVSIQAPDDDAIDLSNGQLWTVILGNGDAKASPVLVRRVRDKLRWKPFFRRISPWTQEYLVLFDGSPSESFNLTMSNFDARVRFTW